MKDRGKKLTASRLPWSGVESGGGRAKHVAYHGISSMNILRFGHDGQSQELAGLVDGEW